MNPYDELVAALFRRVAACRNPKRRGFWADGAGRGPQPSISTGVRDYYMTHHWRTVARSRA